jgi:branched-subunit amino acid transport protein
MKVWVVIALVSAATFLLRASFIVFANPQRFPKRFRQALAFVPPAVLAAFVAPGLLIHAGAIDLSAANPRWIAGVVAIAVGAAHPQRARRHRLRDGVAVALAVGDGVKLRFLRPALGPTESLPRLWANSS